MSESRTFMLNGTEVQSIAARLENFFRTEKSMEVQSSKTVDGFVMQASQPKDGWKTLAGMRLAVSVQMTEMQGQLTVTVGEGQWSDKIGAGAVGLFVAWPLAITAGMGAYKQKKLPGEVFQVIENCIVAGGKTVTVNGAGGLFAPAAKRRCPAARGFAITAGQAFAQNARPAGRRCLRTAPFARRADKSCKE